MHMAVCKDYCFLEYLMISIKAGVFIKHVVQIKGVVAKAASSDPYWYNLPVQQ